MATEQEIQDRTNLIARDMPDMYPTSYARYLAEYELLPRDEFYKLDLEG